MLKLRIITALILLPAVLAGIFMLETHWFGLVWALALNVAAWEWLALSRINAKPLQLFGLVIVNGMLWFAWHYQSYELFAETVLLTAGVVWLAVIMNLRGDPVSQLQTWSQTRFRLLGVATGTIIIVPTWFALVLLHQQTPWLVLNVFCLVWIADIGAYFSGRRWGKRKLAPNISPGKSWEGVYGALVATLLYAIVVAHWLDVTIDRQFQFVAICAVTVAISVYGDLLESVFKRVTGVKDSGRILPGHGGMMDRLDSITAAAPVFAAGMILTGWM